MDSPMTKSAPPRCAVPCLELVDTRMRYGSRMLMISDRRFFRKTMKSACRSDVKIRRMLGAAVVDRMLVLVTDLAPGQADKDIFECHRAPRGLADERIVLVLLDQFIR